MTDDTVQKKISVVTTVTQTQVPPTETNQGDNRQRSSCKAEGATSQTLVANAWKCSMFASCIHI